MIAEEVPPENSKNTVGYKVYVMLVLLTICIHDLASRSLVTYLVTVQVPGCEDICQGVATTPLCESKTWDTYPADQEPTRFEACQQCRARAVSLPPVNMDYVPNNIPVAPSFDEKSRVRDEDAFDWGTNRASDISDELLRIQHNQTQPQRGSKVAKSVFPDLPGVLKSGRFKDGETMNFLVHRGLQNKSAVHDPSKMDASYYNLADGSCLAHWQYGLLIGYGFALVFAIGSLPAAFVCDHKPRVSIAAASILVWSVATSLQASAHDFEFLLLTRALLGLAQAFVMPTAISIMADIFKERADDALACLSVGLYLGQGCASFSIWVAQSVGWRWAVMISGLVGIGIAILVKTTIKEPERTVTSAPCGLSEVSHAVFNKSRVARMLIAAASMKMLAANVFAAFLPIWYSRSALPGYWNTAYAGWNALAISAGGVLSAIGGNMICERLSTVDARAPVWIGLVGSILSLPLICLVLLVDSFAVSMCCFFLLLLVSECWFGPAMGLLQASVARSVRTQAVAMFLVASTLIANLGPALVGFADPGNAGIWIPILIVSISANVGAAVAFVLTAREISLDPVAAGIGPKIDEDFSLDTASYGTGTGRPQRTTWALY